MIDMTHEDLKLRLIKSIQSNVHPANLNSAKNELMIRCCYCGDSQKSALHTHMYIGLDNAYCFPYYCQKCTSSGNVDRNFLKDINVLDYVLMGELEKFNKENTRTRKNKKFSDSTYDVKSLLKKENLVLPDFNGTSREKAKLDYINSRYSFDLEPEQYIQDYKVIFSFKQFIEQNEIEDINLNDYMLKNIIRNYIGFLSSDQSYIIFRNIDPNCKKNERYYMYNIFNNQAGKRFYTCSSRIDLLTPKIELVMSEGPFDIVGIREYFYKGNTENKIFTSVNGKGYGLIVNHFARLGFLNMDITIYSDADVNMGLYYNLKRQNSVMGSNRVKILYNSIEKDYGTKLNRIKLKSNFI